MFGRSTLPGTRKSSFQPPSYEGYNYVSIIASSVDEGVKRMKGTVKLLVTHGKRAQNVRYSNLQL
jgi:hypothetical protein